MPRSANHIPKYSRHKGSGQAVVTIRGKDHYLGPYGTKASHLDYDRLILEWLAAGRPSEDPELQALKIKDIVLRFWKFAKVHYRKDGEPTGTAENYKPALRLLRHYYGNTPAAEFGPKSLKALRQKMMLEGNSRRYINDNVDRIRRVFRWSASEELIPAEIVVALATVESLPKGRSEARETEPIAPVDDATVDVTVPYLPLVVADMVRFQRLTGARPGEVCILRPCDVDRTGEVWLYRPARHKTEHHDKQRVVCIGPRAQDILRPYLLRDSAAFCFCPAESERKRNAARRDARQTPMTPSQAARKPKRDSKRSPKNRYSNDSYRRAVDRACDLAFPPPPALAPQEGESAKQWQERLTDKQRDQLKSWRAANRWAPNQLRHAAGTEIRKRFGLEGAQVALGHSKANVTEIYAERDLSKAMEIARQVG